MFNIDIQQILFSIPAILIAFTFHEYAHAMVADKLGDKTPRFQGRLTLNPIAHIDPIGFILILLLRFGWAKPVETNPRAFKNYYKDDLKVSIAGPLANLAVAIVAAIIFGICNKFMSNSNLSIIIVTLIYAVIQYNTMFFLLNFIPIPGFDGFHILRDLFPKEFYNISDTLYRYQLIIFLVLVMPIFNGYSILSYVISIPANDISNLLVQLSTAIFGM
jgi:Zn-dependent protease